MFRKALPVIVEILDSIFAFPRIVIFGLVACALMGFAIGRMNISTLSSTETAASAYNLTLKLLGENRPRHWSVR
jgi:hypothetical protein